ncbi:MAG: phosphate ABC transporter permease subunit PstC [Ectobacillus sp.]
MAFKKGGAMPVAVRKLIEQKRMHRKCKRVLNACIPMILLGTAIVSIVVTLGIVWTLGAETIAFFQRISFLKFVTETEWLPFFEADPHYGIAPLLCGTFLVTGIAMIIAVPIGLGCAVFLAEYAPHSVKKMLKPALEILAGIPTIVYGFFALTFVTPILQFFIPSLQFFNALSSGIVIGIMMIPTIASLSEDAINAVPASLREASYGLGATRFETIVKAVLPACATGVVASIVLAASRAMGETMIVVIAAGSTPVFSLDATESIQTLTAYIVQVSLGDAPHGTTIYYSMYAAGAVLFIFTLGMNMLAQHIARRFKEVY